MPEILLTIVLGISALGASPQGQVTATDIATVRAKLNLAVPFFNRAWSQAFALQGRQFVAPKVVTYTATINTACGSMSPGNAYFCEGDNTIYLDATFLAEQVKSTAGEMKTDGDFGAIVIAAHEFGHALQQQLGITGSPFDEEQTADCFAGAVTREAKNARMLDAGDLDEGRYAVATSGDPFVRGTLRRLLQRSQPGAHGSPDDRHSAFNKGFYVGAQSCSSVFGTATVRAPGAVLFRSDFAQARPQSSPTCAAALQRGELVVTNAGRQNEEMCFLSLASFNPLPDHFRIEATVRQLQGNTHRGVGVIFGPPLSGRALDNKFAAVVRAEGSWTMYRVSSQVGLPDFLADSLPDDKIQLVARGYGALNRITVDVHRERTDATMLLYVNGKFAGMAKPSSPSFGWLDRSQRRNEQVGLFAQLPGMSAAFSNFLVLELPE